MLGTEASRRRAVPDPAAASVRIPTSSTPLSSTGAALKTNFRTNCERVLQRGGGKMASYAHTPSGLPTPGLPTPGGPPGEPRGRPLAPPARPRRAPGTPPAEGRWPQTHPWAS